MLIREFIEKFEEVFPKDLQASWDNSGLQVGNMENELKGVLTCLEITDEVIMEAIDRGANLILCHHPLLFVARKSLDYKNFIGKKLIDAIRNDICIYASHTSIDANSRGLNRYVFNRLGFESQGRLEETEAGHGYGDYSEIGETNIRTLAESIKEELDLDHIIFYGDEDTKIKKLALATGSGEDFIEACLNKNIDLYITADIKHHQAMDCLEQGLMVMDIGHYNSEKLFNDLCLEFIKEQTPGVEGYSEKRTQKYDRKVF